VENRSGAYNYNNSLNIVAADSAPQAQLTADNSQSWNIEFNSQKGNLASDVQGLVAGLDAAEQAGHQVADDISNHMNQVSGKPAGRTAGRCAGLGRFPLSER
jgi:hypothetical protein